jgi:long-chain fatty acid transport protein
MKKIARAVQLIGAGSIVLVAAQAHASGYHFGVQSVSSQGVANSNAAEAADASVVFYNPAGITNLDGTNFSGALIVVDPHVSASNVKASRTGLPAQSFTGGNGGSPTEPVVVPQMYLTHQFSDNLYAGLGLFVPFGDKTDWDSTWAGRYNGINLELQTLAINPEIAYKINDQFSIGAGVTAQYTEAKFSKAIIAGVVPALPPRLIDGQLNYKGDDWGFGFNLGATWTVDPTLRFGLAYRSSIKHTLSGDAKGNVVASGAPIAALTANGTIDIETPESYSINFMKKLNDVWTITGDYTRTGHSELHEIKLKLANGATATIPQNWNDTNRFSLGLQYQYSDKLKLRTGIAFDQSPVPSDDLRIVGLPDSDRTWFSLGLNYAFSKELSMDVAYTYVDIKNASMKTYEETSKTTTTADFSSYANIFGLQLNYKF